MKKKENSNTYDDLMELAEQYGVADNALFIASAKQYCVQQKVIDNINTILADADKLMTTKEYVKGIANIYANPLVKELPKHADSATKTLNTMLDIINKLGKEKPTPSRLAELADE